MKHTSPPGCMLYLATTIHTQQVKAGGMFSHTCGVIQGLYAHNIKVIYASASALYNKGITCNAYRCIFLYMPNIILTLLGWKVACILSNVFFTFQAWYAIRGLDIQYIYQRYTPFNITGVILAKYMRIPLIIEYNGSEVWVMEHWAKKQKRNFSCFWLARKIESFILKHATYVTVVSQVLKDELIIRAIDKAKICVNFNGVNECFFKPATPVAIRKYKAKKFIKEHMPVVGFIGTFGPWHGINIIQHLIEVFHNEARFILIGNGTLFGQMKENIERKKLQKHVVLPGLLNQEIARDYLSMCDIFLCPNQHNKDGTPFFGSPTKLFEYMSMARPIIASDLYPLNEILAPAITVRTLEYTHKAMGFLAHPEKPCEFEQLLKLVLRMSKYKRDIIGSNVRSKVKQAYTWHKHIEKLYMFCDMI